MQIIIAILICFIGTISYSKESQLLTKMQVSQRLLLIKKQGSINKWHAVISVTPPESESSEYTTVEKLRSGEFIITRYTPIHGKLNQYRRHIDKISSTDKRYEGIQKIEQIEVKINSWSGRVTMDGFSYQLEIDAIDSQTVMTFSEKAFEFGMLPIKQWIDYLRNTCALGDK